MIHRYQRCARRDDTSIWRCDSGATAGDRKDPYAWFYRAERGLGMETGLRRDRCAGERRRYRRRVVRRSWPVAGTESARIPLAATIAIFALAFLLPAWPWLSGAVTIPWDAKSQFFPQVQFLATSFARGEWPWWTPNVFAGWPEISDPQSLLFSPLHVLLAAFNSAISLRAVDAVTFAYLFLGGIGVILFFHDRGWHPGGAVVAALAFALGGAANARMQHTGQVISLVYLPLTLWLLARALDRSSWRPAWRPACSAACWRSGAIRSRCCRSMCWPDSCWRIGSPASGRPSACAPASSRWRRAASPASWWPPCR